MNYATLKQTIIDTTQNSDPVFLSYVDGFIKLAERQIYTEAKLPQVQITGTINAIIGNRSLTLPADHITTRSLSIATAAGTVNLLPKAPSFLEEMYPLSTTQAPPKYYAQNDGTTLSVAPTPDLAYVVTIKYAGLPASIVTASTTWLGDKFEHLLLYAALCHAYIFMKGSADVLAMYKGAYDIALKELLQVIGDTKQDNFR